MAFNILCGVRIAAFTAVAICAAVSCSAAECEDLRIGKLPDGCQRDRVEVPGSLRFLGDGPARASAEENWRRLVIARFGERFAVWNRAACQRVECNPANLPYSHRCIYAGYPCSIDPPEPPVNLSEADKKELQKLLADRNYYDGKIDGDFGAGSSRALKQWQEANNVKPADGVTRVGTLEAVRKSPINR
jgi:hypothetical protein